jgi:hypothetical protein
MGHEFLTTEVEMLFKWRLKGLRLVEGVEVEDPESAKHESLQS